MLKFSLGIQTPPWCKAKTSGPDFSCNRRSGGAPPDGTVSTRSPEAEDSRPGANTRTGRSGAQASDGPDLTLDDIDSGRWIDRTASECYNTPDGPVDNRTL